MTCTRKCLTIYLSIYVKNNACLSVWKSKLIKFCAGPHMTSGDLPGKMSTFIIFEKA